MDAQPMSAPADRIVVVPVRLVSSLTGNVEERGGHRECTEPHMKKGLRR